MRRNLPWTPRLGVTQTTTIKNLKYQVKNCMLLGSFKMAFGGNRSYGPGFVFKAKHVNFFALPFILSILSVLITEKEYLQSKIHSTILMTLLKVFYVSLANICL